MQDGKVVRDLVREGLAAGPRTKAELKAAIDCIDDDKQLANALYRLKHEGELTQDGDGRYHLVAPGERPTPARKAKKKAAKRAGKKEPAREKPPAAAPAPDHAAPPAEVLAHMREAARHSEAALHAYIATLEDPVLDHLIQGARVARDQLHAVQEAPRS